MGGGNWDEEHYTSKVNYRAKTGTSFTYNSDVKSGKVKSIHETLDPSKMKNNYRECRDSEANPKSLPIAVCLDVTGSMQTTPVIMQNNLAKLMGLLIRKQYVDNPAICISAVGDAYYDDYPLQIGQFESGANELDASIQALILEGGGGGNRFESYELFLYFLARCVKSDQYDKRHGKGYAFIVCDESLNKNASKEQIKEIFGITEQDNISTADLVKEASKLFNIFCIVPAMTAHYHSDTMKEYWRELLGQNVLLLEDPNKICEMIASTIAADQGHDIDNIISGLLETGLSKKEADSISKALIVKPDTSGTNLIML